LSLFFADCEVRGATIPFFLEAIFMIPGRL
jgi:hypothetical protein